MATKPDEWTVQGYNVQSGTGTLTHTVSAIPHGSPHAADQRPGYAQPAQPGGHNAQTRIPGGAYSGLYDSLQTVLGEPPVVIQATPITKVHATNWSVLIAVHGGYGNLTYAASGTALPTGVTLSAAGKLTGTAATSAGTTSGIVITATDAEGRSANKTITLTLT
jgi:hypothetical protein